MGKTFFNNALHKFRKRNGLSLEKLAGEIGSSKSYMWQLENQDINVSAKLLFKIASRLRVEMEEFFIEDINKCPECGEKINWSMGVCWCKID